MTPGKSFRVYTTKVFPVPRATTLASTKITGRSSPGEVTLVVDFFALARLLIALGISVFMIFKFAAVCAIGLCVSKSNS